MIKFIELTRVIRYPETKYEKMMVNLDKVSGIVPLEKKEGRGNAIVYGEWEGKMEVIETYENIRGKIFSL